MLVCVCRPATALTSPRPPPSPQPDVNVNLISEQERPALPTVDEVEEVESNEIPRQRNEAPSSHEEQPSNVLMSHASDESIFNKTEVLAGQ